MSGEFGRLGERDEARGAQIMRTNNIIFRPAFCIQNLSPPLAIVNFARECKGPIIARRACEDFQRDKNLVITDICACQARMPKDIFC